MSLIDILFIVTVILLVFNGLRNGALFSLINLVSLPIAFVAATAFGPVLSGLLMTNRLPATPLISYIVVFIGVVLIFHIIATSVRRVVQRIPVIGLGDSLVGGAIGFVEAWLVWLFLLVALGMFLNGVQTTLQGGHIVSSLNIQLDQFQSWHDFYNQAITNSLFAKVNGFLVKELPSSVPHPPQPQ